MRISRSKAKKLGIPVDDAPAKPSKYRAMPTVVEGIRFASKREAKRYRELRLLEQAGEIERLELQPEFPLVVSEVVIGRYLGDFRYVDKRTGKTVVEDVKSGPTKTPVYRLKKKIVEIYYGIRIIEV